MPEISRFLGIIIFMYFDEHDPPHLHVKYNEYRASMSLKEMNIIAGSLPAKVRGIVQEWMELHQKALLQMWETQEFHRVEPLV